MKTLYLAVSFLMTLGIILGIYTASYNQFNLNGATTTYSTTNQVIVNGGSSAPLETVTTSVTTITTVISNTTSVITSTITVPVNSSSGSSCISVIPFACDIQSAIFNAAAFIGCQLGDTADCQPNTGQLAQNLQNSLQPTSPNIPGVSPLITNNALSSTNQWLKLFANPLDSALTIMGIFLGLGILAGLLGAGILARVMASVGIGLALIDYIESSIAVFTGLPSLIYIGFNGIIGMLLLIIAWEAFNAPGGT